MQFFQRLAIITLFLLPFLTFSQSSRLKYANKLFAEQSFHAAVETYEDVLERGGDSVAIGRNIAESYFKFGAYDKAIEWYEFIYNKEGLDRDETIRLALLYRRFGRYNTSNQILDACVNEHGSNDITENYLSGSIDTLSRDKAFTLRMQEVNSDASEVGTNYWLNDHMIVSSSRRPSAFSFGEDKWTGQSFYNLYIAKKDSEDNLVKLKKMRSKARTRLNDSFATIDTTSGYVYFTSNIHKKERVKSKKRRDINLGIYRGRLEGNSIKEVELLPFNSNQFSCTNPSLTPDGKYLYFSSNKPGGYGGMDLYIVNIDSLGSPQNLGEKINTSLDELFPYYHASERILFFSSEGHKGFGGLDVFAAYLDKTSDARTIKNLGSEVNSISDDLSFIINDDMTKGFLSSARENGEGSDDIYGFDLNSPLRNTRILNGMVYDVSSNEKLKSAKVFLISESNLIIDSTTSSQDGLFEFDIMGYSDNFQVRASKKRYLDSTEFVVNVASEEDLNVDLGLRPFQYLIKGIVRDKSSGLPLIGALVEIKDKFDNTNSSVLTANSGEYMKEIVKYSKSDEVSFELIFSSDGYAPVTLNKEEVLFENNEIIVDAELEKIEIGVDLGELLNLNPIYFDLNSSYLRTDAKVELDKIVKVLLQNPEVKIDLNSHTDTRASHHYNMWLSDRRAMRSANYIISQGIDASRITYKGYGETKLVVSDDEISRASGEDKKEELHQLNRRTEFIVVE